MAILKPFIAGVLLAGLVTFTITSRATITAYMPFLINGFNAIGLTIRPALSQLQVVRLNANFTGDTMRLSGALRNNGVFLSHAADLQVTVHATDGNILKETVLRPEHNFILGNSDSEFFIQLVIDARKEAHVTVTPLANRIYR